MKDDRPTIEEASKRLKKFAKAAAVCIPGSVGCLPGKKSRLKRTLEIIVGITIWVLIAIAIMHFNTWLHG